MLGLIVLFQNITLGSFTSYTIIYILEITASYTSYFMRIVSLRIIFSPISGNQTFYHFRIASYFPSFWNHSQFTIHELTILERLKVNEPILENSLRHLLQISIDLVVQLYLPVERRKDGGNAALVFYLYRYFCFQWMNMVSIKRWNSATSTKICKWHCLTKIVEEFRVITLEIIYI